MMSYCLWSQLGTEENCNSLTQYWTTSSQTETAGFIVCVRYQNNVVSKQPVKICLHSSNRKDQSRKGSEAGNLSPKPVSFRKYCSL